MPYKNESETLTKCSRCGWFINANDAWYEKQSDGYVEPMCDKCHNKTNKAESNAVKQPVTAL